MRSRRVKAELVGSSRHLAKLILYSPHQTSSSHPIRMAFAKLLSANIAKVLSNSIAEKFEIDACELNSFIQELLLKELGSKASKKSSVPRKPSGYILFSSHERTVLKKEGFEGNAMAECGARWKALDQKQKDKWNEKAKAAPLPSKASSTSSKSSKSSKVSKGKEEEEEGLSYTKADLVEWGKVRGGLPIAELRNKAQELGFEVDGKTTKKDIIAMMQAKLDEESGEEEDEEDDDDDEEKVSYTQADLDEWGKLRGGLPIAELRKKAQELGFEVDGKTTKKDIIAMMQVKLDEEGGEEEETEDDEEAEEESEERVTYSQADLDEWGKVRGGLPIAELRKKAQELGFEVDGKTTKKDIIAMMQAKLDEGVYTQGDLDEWAKLPIAELRKKAQELGFEVDGKTTKKDIIAKMQVKLEAWI
jgi:hypothetical protein